jgi:predicted nucleic acid-binding protein
MRYLLDTNIVSELRKGARCDPAVAAWEQAELIPHGGAISVLTIGEIRKGMDLIAQRDRQQAASNDVKQAFLPDPGRDSWLEGRPCPAGAVASTFGLGLRGSVFPHG